MRESISKREFIFSLIFNGINLILWPYFIYVLIDLVTPLWALTHITYHFNSFYLHLCLISDVSLYCFGSNKLEKINDFMRNKYSPVINPISYLVFFLYWILYAMGGMDKLEKLSFLLRSIYLHLIISLIIIIELFSANHNRQHFSIFNLILCFVYLILYIFIALIATIEFNRPPYPFIKEATIITLIIYFICFSVALIFCYLFHIFLLYIKYRFILRIDSDYYNNTLSEQIINKEIATQKFENNKEKTLSNSSEE